MPFTLYYALDFGPSRTRYARFFPSREAALEYAVRLYCYGYAVYALRSEDGEELDAAQILATWRRLPRDLLAAPQES